jgi:hypothetical protein
MAADRKRRPDVSIVGSGAWGSRHSTRRNNVDSPVRPGKVYRRVFAATEVSGRLLEGDSEGER